MKKYKDILEKTVPESIYNHTIIHLEITRGGGSCTLYKLSGLQLRDAQIEENHNNDKDSLIKIIGEASKIHLNIKYKYDS